MGLFGFSFVLVIIFLLFIFYAYVLQLLDKVITDAFLSIKKLIVTFIVSILNNIHLLLFLLDVQLVLRLNSV